MLMEKIRYIKENEYYLLEDFLYEAIFIPEEIEPPPRDIIQKEELQVYIRDFGKLPDDNCLVAEIDGRVVGGDICCPRLDGFMHGFQGETAYEQAQNG